jgi:hypothetical protein
MKRLRTILILTLATITCWGQTKEEKRTEDRLQFVFESNLPEELRDFCNHEKIKSTFKINRDLNPFYLRGDFNGDKSIDYALSVVEVKTDKKGIIIYHPSTKTMFILGAGKQIPNGYERDDMNWMDAWHICDRKEIEQGVTDQKPPKLIGEPIYTDQLESSSGIIYWDGKEYKWYQQGD